MYLSNAPYEKSIVAVKINPDWIEEAKRRTAEFDQMKSLDKFQFGGNWIGWLGEKVFSEVLITEDKEHEWSEFAQTNTITPDFIIDGKTIDVKTTRGLSLIVTDKATKFDLYVSIRISDDNTTAMIMGYADKERVYKRRTKDMNGVPVKELLVVELKPIWELIK